MSHCFRSALFNLGLHLRGRCGIVDDDAELIVMNEEATGRPLPIGIEGDSLDGKVTDVTSDHDANKTEQAT